jgi:hypothetical protein
MTTPGYPVGGYVTAAIGPRIPLVLAVECRRHGAAVGVPCWDWCRAVCGERIARALNWRAS